MSTLLEVIGLTRAFGGLVAVNDVSFSVAPAEIMGLIGPNGAGKTTVFNMLGGALMPSAGRITFDGTACTGMPAHHMARLGITRTFQITSVFPGLSTLDNVRCAGYRTKRAGWRGAFLRSRVWRREEDEIAAEAHAILAFVELDARADALADALSYGEQRKLEIAIALAAAPRLLLLDEPAAGLNPDEGARLITMIKRIQERGIAVLLVEHHMRVVMGVCDRIVVIDHGIKIAEGAPSAVANDPEVVRVYLGREPAGA
jgi:branched-chain amino acid transport system ATP-binding protein